MEQWPSKATVIGEFDGNPITYRDIKVTSLDGKRTETVTFDVVPFEKDGGYFFTVIDKDNAANNQTFKIAKTLGGKWDQGYEILVGKNYYPALLRYSNSAGGAWLVQSFFPRFWVEPDGTADGRPRRAEELPKDRVAEAKCAGCHTTGYDYVKDAKGVWQYANEGELGVGCEKCHGPGSAHVAAAEVAKASGRKLERADLKIVHGLKDLDHNQQNQLCAQCHGRSSNRQHAEVSFPLGYLPGDLDITEKLVFWNYQSTRNPDQARYFYRNNWAKRNRQQWQDHQLSTHNNKAGMSCLTCHAFHGKWENMQLRTSPEAMCRGCHTAEQHAARPQTEMYRGSKMEQAGVQCIDCHMARIGFRSHLTKKTEKAKGYPMDGSSHHYLVPTPAVKRAYGVRTACEACHQDGRSMPPWIEPWVMQKPMGDDALETRMAAINKSTRKLIDEVQAGLAAASRGEANMAPGQRAVVERARGNLNLVLLDGSVGFHNPEKTTTLLREASALLASQGGSAIATGQVDPRSAAVVAKAFAGAAVAQASPAARVPSETDAPTSAIPVAGHWYQSRPGDNLWVLSRTLYGKGDQFRRIYEANMERMPDGASVLVPGTRLYLPR
jgi:predicted CXXCH cytochrome family protein